MGDARPPLIVSGVILLIGSAPPLLLMARETVVGAYVESRYSVVPIAPDAPGTYAGALRARIGAHTVELIDDEPIQAHEPFKADSDRRANGLVSVAIDGQTHGPPVQASIRVTRRDANRYWGYVYLFRLLDRRGPARLVVAQNLGGNRYQTISIFEDGAVVDDRFEYGDWCTSPVRAAMIRTVVPHPVGFCSDVMQGLPTVWYPILYPLCSGMVGAALLIVGYVKRPE